MVTLYDALLDLARYCGVTVSGKTTAMGSALYLIDTNRYEVDDYFNNGTVFIRSGDNDGITRRVTDYDQALGKITISPGAANTIDDGVYYTATNVNRDELVQAVNQALLGMGKYKKYDETLETVDDATEYVLPSGVNDIRRIDVIADTEPKHLYRLYHWLENDGKIILPRPIGISSGRAIRIYYQAYHDEVNDDADVIRDEYNRERLAWTATAMFLLNRTQYSGNTDEKENFLLQNAISRSQELARKHPVPSLNRDPILARW